MRPQDLIRIKRDGGALNAEQIRAFVRGVTSGEVPDYQAAALLMAVFLRGMNRDETVALTRAMLESGSRADLSSIPGVKVDKHSTGGVGDKTSIPLAALVAACGVPVPMISGRGLGHTGGTLDKLESIKGFRTDLSIPEFVETVRKVGACLIGPTADLAPADKKLYALRDVTGTVECAPLIASSILSKKAAEGIDALVVDVKTGSGSFLKGFDRGRELARTIAEVGTGLGLKVVAFLTDMDQPLGHAVGNALEVEESIACLRGKGPPDLEALVVELAAEMLVLAGSAKLIEAARERIRFAIRDGSGLRKLREIVVAQGGQGRVVDEPERLPRAESSTPFPSPSAGFVTAIDAEAIGLAAMALGAGRRRVEDRIDPAAGIVLRRKLGERVEAGEPLLEFRHAAKTPLDEARAHVARAYRFGPAPPPARPVVLGRILG
ncbi:MAG TPA: thymidine phosphorylase [Planctomycetota bacterium]|nr:thymidine phosphorylase [Planctomycetota bacterium]